MYLSSHLRRAISGFLLFTSPLVSATCQNWTYGTTNIDTASGGRYEGHTNTIFLENRICPSANKTGCIFQPKTYDFTIERKLNISVSEADEDSIFNLARENYGPRGFDAPIFITRNTTVSTAESRYQIYVEVEPGKNKTLRWMPYMLYSSGRLGGCDNSTLNGVYVRAKAPYMMRDERNISILAGGFDSYSTDIDEEKGSAVRARGCGSALGILGVVGLATLFSTSF